MDVYRHTQRQRRENTEAYRYGQTVGLPTMTAPTAASVTYPPSDVPAMQSAATEDKPPHGSLASQIQKGDCGLHPHPQSTARTDGSSASSVQVVVRVRPMLGHESGSTSCVQIRSSSESAPPNMVCLGGPNGPKFTFDQAFDSKSTQMQVFASRVQPLIDNCLEGYNATCLAYGQTGSGKTHTIMGPSSSTGVLQDELHQGVIPRAIRAIFNTLNTWKAQRNAASNNDQQHTDDLTRRQLFGDNGYTDISYHNPSSSSSSNSIHSNNQNNGDRGDGDDDDDDTPCFDYQVSIQFLEVYGEEIRDLLTTTSASKQTKLIIRDIGTEEPEVLGATRHPVSSADEALLCLTRGMLRRVTGATAMNETSSRSHAILSIHIEQSSVVDDNRKANDVPPTARLRSPGQKLQHMQTKRSKFNFVDLAGSERQKRTQASGQRLKEGIDINKGLLVLGNVISALGDPTRAGKTFVPYRDSKLTRLLKGSLGGNHKTLMIACVSPSNMNVDETLNCLRYANRAKNIQNHAVVNVDATTRLVQELKTKLQGLARDVLRVRKGQGDYEIPVEALESLARGEDISLGINVGESGSSSSASSWTPVSVNRSITDSSSASAVVTPNSDSFIGTASAHPSTAAAEERICALEAEKEMYRLQLEALASSSGNGSDSPTASKDVQDAFLKRATDYEHEISKLKREVQLLHAPSLHRPSQDRLPGPTRAGRVAPGKALPPKVPQHKRAQSGDLSHRSESPELSRLKAQMHDSLSQSDQIDAEVTAAEEADTALTQKYLTQDDDEDDGNDGGDGDGKSMTDQRQPDDVVIHQTQFVGEDMLHSHQQLEVDLYELSSSIIAKEELIEKLQASQDKYQAMREFYEARLHEMGELLQHKERESEKLADELKLVGSNHESSTALQYKLREKQTQIAELRRKQRDLTKLTSVVSKNQSQIARLRRDVIDMKQKKVTLQKQIAEERKSHMVEMNRLRKEAMQKDRQMTKLKKKTEDSALEAEKSKRVAKTRLEQISQLRAKNKDFEKKLRLRTIKQGVMHKAGFDAVLTGRMSAADSRSKSASRKGRSSGNTSSPDAADFRKFFDDKIAVVSKREALAEKLANEWEDHLELSTKKADLLESRDDDTDDEVMKAVVSQIKSKEERIRQLASRLGKRSAEDDDRAEKSSFLFDATFKDLCKEDPLAAARCAIKVAFGMIVRERRRVTKLARAASRLDDKVQRAEVELRSKDVAFRAFEKEKQDEITALTQSQQEHILSLMEIVQGNPSDSSESSSHGTAGNFDVDHGCPAPGSLNPKMLILANERIAALQRHIGELEGTKRALLSEASRMKDGIDESKSVEADQTTVGCIDLDKIKSVLENVLQQVEKLEALMPSGKYQTKQAKTQHSVIAVLRNMATNGLAIAAGSKSDGDDAARENGERSPAPRTVFRTNGVSLSSSDSDDDDEAEEEDPEWADEIMADLAIIAQGKIPSSLLPDDVSGTEFVNSAPASNPTPAPKKRSTSVFDRLSDPKRFTGVQKQKLVCMSHHSNKPVSVDDVATTDGRGRQSDAWRNASTAVLSGHGTNSSVADGPRTPSRSGSASRRAFVTDSSASFATPSKEDEKGSVRSSKRDGDEQNDGRSNGDLLRGKRREYARLNVFERLTKTTTQAYAPKQHKNIAEEMLDDILDGHQTSGGEPKSPHVVPEFARVNEYAKRNVFDRLTQTTTQAYAVKSQRSLSSDGHSDGGSLE